MQQYNVFYIKNVLVGINITQLKSINKNIEIYPVPESPDFILGLINDRRQIVTVFDMGILFGLGETQISDKTKIIILKTDNELDDQNEYETLNDANVDRVGLIFEGTSDIVKIDKKILEIKIDDCKDIPKQHIEKVYNFNKEKLYILDLQSIINRE